MVAVYVKVTVMSSGRAAVPGLVSPVEVTG